MKVELKPAITRPKPTLFTRIKKFFVGKIKLLKADTFEKCACSAKNKEVIVSREYPNWCEGANSKYRNNTIAERICYYPEDLKIMETMTKKEAFAYMDHLDRIGRYYHDPNFHVDTPALDRVTKEYGIDIRDFVVKDKE